MVLSDDFPAGQSFLSESVVNQIAARLDELVVKMNVLSRFREKVIEWDEGFGRKVAAKKEWENRRGKLEADALIQAGRLDKDAEPPEPGWCFEEFVLRGIADGYVPTERHAGRQVGPVPGRQVYPVVGAWFPPDLCRNNCPPEARMPLPVPCVEVELCEMYAALSAIYDHASRGNPKIDPWARDPNPGAGTSFYSLMKLVSQLPESDESHLLGWIRRVEKDLQTSAKKDAPPPAGQDARDDRPVLSRNASLVYELLCSRPEHLGMTGPEIVRAVFDEHHENLDESTLRKSILPALKPYGLEHVKRIGYRIKPSQRATGQ